MLHKNELRQDKHSFPFAHKGRVLLVDEDRRDLRYYCMILQQFGYQVRGCDSYEEGTHLLESERFDFVIVSQGGPNFKGRFVLERANQVNRHLPVLVVARYLDMKCYLAAMEMGAVDYLSEPLTFEELRQAVDSHLRPHAAARAAGD